MKELNVDSKIENIHAVMDFVTAELVYVSCPAKIQVQIKTAIDELFSNICFYAYDPGPGPVTIQAGIDLETHIVTLVFVDRGKPYNPLEADPPDLSLSGEERPIGGLGIFMTRELMDDMQYEYKDGQNILTLKKSVCLN